MITLNFPWQSWNKISYFCFRHASSVRNAFFKAKTAKCCLTWHLGLAKIDCSRLSVKPAGDKRDQWRAGFGREKERAGEPVSILLKTSFRPLEKRNRLLCQNVKYQNLCLFGIKLLARVSRGQADLHSVLRSSAIVSVCCVSSENIFDCRSLCVDVQKINYWQRSRPIWRIETIIL